jgi:hypothetical protein
LLSMFGRWETGESARSSLVTLCPFVVCVSSREVWWAGNPFGKLYGACIHASKATVQTARMPRHALPLWRNKMAKKEKFSVARPTRN